MNSLGNLFEQSFLRYKDRVAVRSGLKVFTYQDMHDISNNIASYLTQYGVKKGQHVGIYTEKSEFTLFYILALIKMGVPYVPIDPNSPKERTTHIILKSNIVLLLGDKSSGDEVVTSLPCMYLNIFDVIENSKETKPEILENVQSDDPAYIIFTSGSTGEPKGVCVTHGNVISLFDGCHDLFEFSHQDKWTFYHSHAFDFSVWEIWGAWLYGGQVTVVKFEESRNPLALVELMVQTKTTVFNCTPSAFFEVKEELIKRQNELQLRYIIFGGEALNFRKLQSWFEEVDEGLPKLINMYGITETTIHVTFKEISNKDVETGITNIGQVLPHLDSMVIKENGSSAKVGEEGELYISGKGLSLGYYKNNVMNDQRFIHISGMRYYKTGDIVKVLPNREFQYISRNDHQVQVRGFRIELGEIESAFNEVDTIKNVVAVAEKIFNDDIHIILYYVEKEKTEVDRLKKAVIDKLPSYMMPSYFVSVEAIPMTENGKLDKSKLPSIQNLKPQKNVNVPLIVTSLRDIIEEVLGNGWINDEESLLENGMNSLSIMRLILRISQQFQVELSPATILMNDSIYRLSKVIQGLEVTKKNNVSTLEPIKLHQQNISPLSFEQENLWFIDQTCSDKSLYNLIFSYEIIGNLQLDKLEVAFNQLAKQQKVLNSNIQEKDGKGYLTYHDAIYHSIHYTDLTKLGALEQQKEMEHLIDKECNRVFNLEKDALLKIHLQKFTENKYLLIGNIHHIIFDGWSLPLLINAWFSLYETLISDKNKETDIQVVQYSDYAIWQRKSEYFIEKKDLLFWQNEIETEFKPLLQYDYPKVNDLPLDSQVIQITLTDELFEKIKQFNKQTNSTLFISLLSAFQTFLSVYYDEEKIVIGSPVANRNQPNIEKTIGYFVNTLPFKAAVEKNESFISFVNRNIKAVSDVLAHQHVPTEQILKQVKLDRIMDSAIFFDTVFVLQNNNQVHTNYNSIKLQPKRVNTSKAKFDLVVQAEVWDGKLAIAFEYNKSLFKEEKMQRMAHNFIYWLKQIFSESTQKLLDLDYIEPSQQEELLKISTHQGDEEFNKVFEDVITKFKKSVKKMPTKIAAVHNENKITYSELDSKSNQIAQFLREKGVRSQQKIGVFMDRSIEMIASVLSIMKLGAVYVPIDPTQPTSRLEYMVEDASLSFCLIDTASLSKYPAKQDNLIIVNDIVQKNSFTSVQFVCEKITENQLAYIIYTSGTTGNPKGVMIEHASLSNLCDWHIDYYQVKDSDAALLVSSISFDASVWELFPYITNGNKIVVVDYFTLLDVDLLAEKLEEEQVTMAFFSTGLLEQLFINEMMFPSSIRAILTGGDQLKKLPEKLSFDLFNNYGPTEGTVVSTVYKIENIKERIIPIGMPITNVEVLVLNSDYKLVPKGQIGELFIGGKGLARGYIGQTHKNSENFIPHPFDAERKLYKTGDLVKYNENNELIFSGRQDDQVKIRGYRVELGEINAVLKQYDGIKDCVISVNDESNERKFITAYYLSDQAIKQSDLEKFLESRLPAYMIPSYFIHMDYFPLTQNGKIELKKMPNPMNHIQKETQTVETNDIEQTLLMIWKSVLKNENITILDNYFECGGDSILSIQICSKAKTYGLLITSRDIFEKQTIQRISKVAKVTKETHHTQAEVTGEMPLTPIQKWFFQQDIEQYHHWNQSIVMTGYPLLNKQRLEQLVNRLVEHHDALRTIYDMEHRRAIIQPTKQVRKLWDAKYIDLSHENVDKQQLEIDRLELEAQQSLNIYNGPLSQILCVKINEHVHKIIWIIHHLNVDGVSWRILIEDFEKLYNQSIKDSPLRLGNKTSSFKTWAEKLATYQNCIDKDIQNFWLDVCSKPYKDKLKKSNNSNKYDESAFEITLTSEITQNITKELTRRQITTDELYISIFTKIIGEFFGKKDIHFNLEGHGREELFSDVDLSRTIGWFTSLYPIYLRNESSLENTISFTKKQTKDIPNKGLEYGLLMDLEGMEALRGNIPVISFNNLGKYYSSNDEQSEITFFSQNDIPQNIYTDHEINIELITVNNKQKITVHFNTQFTGKEFESYFTKRLYQLLDEIVYVTNGEAEGLGTIVDTYELTEVQKGILYHSLVDEDSDQYKVQLTFNIQGDLDVDKLKEAILKTVEKHEILRTFFISDKNGLFHQVIMRYILTPINVEDLKEVNSQEQLNRLKAHEYQQINIENNKLNRFLIVKSKEAYKLIWTFHHILMDGWSYSTVIQDISLYYDGQNALTEAPTSFKSYVEYMKHYIKQPKIKAFWNDYLKNAQLITTPFFSNSSETYSETIFTMTLEESRKQDINQICIEHKLTLNTFFLTIWLMTLKKVKQSNFVSCGIVTSGRGVSIPKIEKMVGPFINTVPFVYSLEKESPHESMKEIQKSIFELMEYSNSPLSVIQEVTGIAHPLFDSLYAFENYPMSLPSMDHLQVTLQESKEISHYPIVVTVIPGSSIEIKFNDALVHEELRKSIISVYENTMETVLAGIYEKTINEG